MRVAERIARVFDRTCTIQRAAEGVTADLDQEIGDFANVDTGVRCHLVPLQASDDMIVAGPEPVLRGRLFLPADTSIEQSDRIIMDDDSIWTVILPPATQTFRDQPSHIEAIVEQVPVT